MLTIDIMGYVLAYLLITFALLIAVYPSCREDDIRIRLKAILYSFAWPLFFIVFLALAFITFYEGLFRK